MISPAIGLISITLYSFGLSFFDSLYMSMFLPILLLLFLQKDALVPSIKKLLFLNIFIVIMSLSAILGGDYNYALLIFARANALIIFALIVFYKRDLFDIASAMQTLKMPNKLATLFFFVAKFVVIIKDEFNTSKKAMKVRNFRAKSNLFTYKIYANMIGMLVVKCFDRAEKLKNTMILRNFQGKIYQMREEKFSKYDFLLLAVVVLSISIHFGKVSL